MPDWNEMFAGEGYRYGTAPAGFVTRQMADLPQGTRLLTVAEGEGRNAVWLAARGCRVTAVEQAPNALAKARALADAAGVQIDWIPADLNGFDWPDGGFDAVLGCFFQFAPSAFRDRIFAGMMQALRPGGTVYLHGFSTRQMGFDSGGPRIPDQLYTPALLRAAFPGWQVLRADDYDATVDGGSAHSGIAALVDFIASKPV